MFRFDGTNWIEEQKLTVSDAAEVTSFGSSVGISSEVIVVTATGNRVPGSNSGAAYVFRFDGTDWVDEQKLTASNPAGVDLFGRSVAASGDTIVVGAFKDGVLGLEFGAAYVYRFDRSSWIEEQKLTASDIFPHDLFGFSVSVLGDTIVVGSFHHNDGGPDSGSAYVYRFDGTDWVEEQKLNASDAVRDDKFGVSVAISGDAIVVGAIGPRETRRGAGLAYVFRFDGAEWIEERKLTASDADLGDGFGKSVAVSGEVIVVGALGNSDPGLSSGSAYVFRE